MVTVAGVIVDAVRKPWHSRCSRHLKGSPGAPLRNLPTSGSLERRLRIPTTSIGDSEVIPIGVLTLMPQTIHVTPAHGLRPRPAWRASPAMLRRCGRNHNTRSAAPGPLADFPASSACLRQARGDVVSTPSRGDRAVMHWRPMLASPPPDQQRTFRTPPITADKLKHVPLVVQSG